MPSTDDYGSEGSGGDGASGAGGTGSGNQDPGPKKQEPQYTKKQKEDRALVTKGLADKTNIDNMSRWGDSSKERRKKCTLCPLHPELARADMPDCTRNCPPPLI